MPNAIHELEVQREIETLTPGEYAAILLAALGRDTAARIYSNLSEEEVGQLLLQAGLLRPVSPGMRRRILGEFRARLRSEGLS